MHANTANIIPPHILHSFSRSSPSHKRPLPSPDPITPQSRAWVQGVIDTFHAVHSGLSGLSNGKVYHNYPLNSDEELAWHSACAYTANRLIQSQILKESLKEETPTQHT